MNPQLIDHDFSSRRHEFYFPNLDTQVLVDEAEDAVVIRATRATFSERRKIFFIHELAAEGFIDEAYRWFEGFGSGGFLPVRWVVDRSWVQPNTNLAARTRRCMFLLLGGAAVLWVILMGLFLLSTP